MNSTSENQDLELNRLSSASTSFSLPYTAFVAFKTTLDDKLDHLFEVTTIPKDKKIEETNLHVLNPYQAFTKKSASTFKSIKTLIKPLNCTIKENV